jgi:hypothetical protein
MPPDGLGNIRVFVRWHDQTVFAGEEVKCTITFKNAARPPGSTPNHSAKPSPRLPSGGAFDQRQPSPLHGLNRSKSPSALAPPAAIRGHRATASLSLAVPSAASRARAGSVPWSPQTSQDHRLASPGTGAGAAGGNRSNGRGHGHGHKKSLSIVSMGPASTGNEQHGDTGSAKPQRPARGHARASSLQIVPRGGNSVAGPRSGENLKLTRAWRSIMMLTTF